MKRGLIINYNAIASYLAQEDSKVQGEFLRTFLDELNKQCDSFHLVEMQLISVNKELNEKERKLIGYIGYTEEVE